MPQFNRYIGIDYSGAETADSSCKGIRVFMAEGSGEPIQVQPPPSPRRYWTRRGLAEWLCEEAWRRDIPTIVGIDHAFSFPLAYFEKYRLSSDWQDFLVDFHHHWPTDARNTYVSFIREDSFGERPKANRGAKLAPGDRTMDGHREIRLRLRRSGRGCHIDARRSSVAPLYAEKVQVALYTSGRLMAGKFPRANRLWPRSTRHCGCGDSQEMAGTAMSKLRMLRRHGCNVRTRMAH